MENEGRVGDLSLLRDAVGDELEGVNTRFGIFGFARGGDVVRCEAGDVGERVGGAGTCGGGGHVGDVVLDEGGGRFVVSADFDYPEVLVN